MWFFSLFGWLVLVFLNMKVAVEASSIIVTIEMEVNALALESLIQQLKEDCKVKIKSLCFVKQENKVTRDIQK